MGWAFIFVFYPSLTLEGKSNRIKMDNPEKLAVWGTQEEEKHNISCVGHHYAQTNTSNVNKA